VRCSIVLLALGWLAVGCRANPQEPAVRNVWVDPRWPYALMQADLYDVVAYDTVDGAERWHYRREQPPPAPFGQLAVPTVLCRPEWTASHNIVLRFDDAIHVITAETGELLWTKDLPFRDNCPTATPDSGVVVIAANGTRLEKLRGDGQPLWIHDFWELGPAIAQPVVVQPSGDTLVRTAKWLFNVSPAGRRNWVAEPASSPPPRL